MGSNDYINNYLMPNGYSTNQVYNPNQDAEVLVGQYSLQLKTLYNLEAQKFVVIGVGLIGCTRIVIAKFGTKVQPCVDSINNALKQFNLMTDLSLVNQLNNDKSDARFTFINMTSIATPQKDVLLPNVPCCPVRGDGQCVPNSKPCPVQDFSVFFDGFHYTKIVTEVLARRSCDALSPMDASPFDISDLARL